jgi:hypothetical protein
MRFATCHSSGREPARSNVTEAEEERARVVGIIQGRIDVHSRFIEYCMDNDVRVTPSIFSAVTELRSLLRKIECRD